MWIKAGILVATLAFTFAPDQGCDAPPPQSASGVSKASVQVPVGNDGLTAEQHNVKQRLLEDNKPGAIKHLYVISPYSGQVILYSTVRGKVTSGGKRLTPTNVATNCPENTSRCAGFSVDIGDHTQVTNEVLEDDGTYGSSGEYLLLVGHSRSLPSALSDGRTNHYHFRSATPCEECDYQHREG
jgi:hypothetical protein